MSKQYRIMVIDVVSVSTSFSTAFLRPRFSKTLVRGDNHNSDLTKHSAGRTSQPYYKDEHPLCTVKEITAIGLNVVAETNNFTRSKRSLVQSRVSSTELSRIAIAIFTVWRKWRIDPVRSKGCRDDIEDVTLKSFRYRFNIVSAGIPHMINCLLKFNTELPTIQK